MSALPRAGAEAPTSLDAPCSSAGLWGTGAAIMEGATDAEEEGGVATVAWDAGAPSGADAWRSCAGLAPSLAMHSNCFQNKFGIPLESARAS